MYSGVGCLKIIILSLSISITLGVNPKESYGDVIWTSLCLKWRATRCLSNRLFRPTTTKKHKSLHYWPFTREIHCCHKAPGFPSQGASNAKNSLCHDIIMSWRHHFPFMTLGWSWQCLEDWGPFGRTIIASIIMTFIFWLCTEAGTFLAGKLRDASSSRLMSHKKQTESANFRQCLMLVQGTWNRPAKHGTGRPSAVRK